MVSIGDGIVSILYIYVSDEIQVEKLVVPVFVCGYSCTPYTPPQSSLEKKTKGSVDSHTNCAGIIM